MSKITYKDYDTTTIKKLQETERQILSDFDDICRRNHISYFMLAGSAIGCAREKGMIKWDDDIDIGMLRCEYEKFLQVYKKEFGTRYSLYAPDSDNRYYNVMSMVSMNDTKLTVELAEGLYDIGIFMDIFIFENIPDDETEADKHIKKCLFWRNLYVSARANFSYLKNEGIIGKVKYLICTCLRKVMNIADRNGDWMFSQYHKLATKYYGKTSTYTLLCDPYAKKNVLYEREINPLIDMEFDGINVKMLNQYDTYLTRRYGDYMTPPPDGQKANHSPVELKFKGDSNERI